MQVTQASEATAKTHE